MADGTAIEWADATLNLWFGCTQVSPACDHCYAMRWGPRLGVKWNGPPKRAAESAFDRISGFQRSAKRYNALHSRPRRVFINSLSDFFDNQAEQGWRSRACLDMEFAPDVIFILVTKRPQLVARMVPPHWTKPGGWPANVWLLVTAENQVEYDRRVAHLLTVPGPTVRGISMEPMLEAIDPGQSISGSAVERAEWCSRHLKRPIAASAVGALRWNIIGGESGRGARPMPYDSAQLITVRFGSIGIAVFVKQLSAADYPDTFKDYASFPPGLRRREHP